MSKKKRKSGNGGVYTMDQITSTDIPNNSRQLEEFQDYIEYIRPPYEPEELLRIVEESDILKPLIDALASNTALFGYGIRYRQDFDYNHADAAVQKEADDEYDKLNTLYRYFNVAESFSRILYKAAYDKEAIGYGAIEILRNGAGEVCGGEYARACNFRIAVQSRMDRTAEVKQFRMVREGFEMVEVTRRFRKFVQIINGEKVYFKEFGDPRQMDCKTGEYKDSVAPERQATEILFLTNHCAYSDYGVPKWAGNIPNLIGNRKSEELNLVFFLQGKMMPFAITVSGGQLTDESVEALKKGKGVDNAFKALLLEALPDEKASGIEDKNGQRVAINIEHLTDTSLSDGLFMEYQGANRGKVRGAFRLPPIYLGDSSDYTRATADVAKMVAEEQVFIPERDAIAELFNSVVSNEMQIKYCEMYLKGPKIGDVSEIASALQPFIAAGTVTPNMLIDTLGELLGKDIECTLPDEIGNTPIEILKIKMQAQTGEQDIQKMAAVSTFDSMLSLLKDYLGDADGY